MSINVLLRWYLGLIVAYLVNLTFGFWRGVVSFQDWQGQFLTVGVGLVGALLVKAIEKSPEEKASEKVDTVQVQGDEVTVQETPTGTSQGALTGVGDATGSTRPDLR